MNDTEFETRIAEIMNENVNQTLADVDRRPPVFDPDRKAAGSKSQGRKLPWLMPLAAAAAVAAVTVGVFAVTNSDQHKHTAPGSHGTTGVTKPPTAPTTPTTPPRITGTATGPTVTLGGASITLPAGWVARDYHLYEPAGTQTLAAQQWCLTPANHPASTSPGSCALTLGTIPVDGNEVDVDIAGGWSSDPPQCIKFVHENAADKTFGGRPADWRHFTATCSGRSLTMEQYVVAAAPGFILYSDQATAPVSAAMAFIAQHASLPAQTSSVRLMDRGYLRSATISGSTVRVEIDRAIPLVQGGVLNNNPATYSYNVPLSMYQGANVSVGALVSIYTNGETARDFAKR